IYALLRGADIILIQGGGPMPDSSLCDIIRMTGPNVLFVGTSGNEGRDLDLPAPSYFPSHCQAGNLVIVTSLDASGELARFGSYGVTTVHVAAPGVDIPGIDQSGLVAQYSGASIAASLVTGVAALVK